MPELNGKKYSYSDKGKAEYQAALRKLKKKRKKKMNGDEGDNFIESGLGTGL